MKRRHIALLFIGCLIFWILGIWAAHCFAPRLANGTDYANVGILGDSAGAINALFSALAFAGVIIAIILQKKELELQRDELRATNAQLEAQKEEFHTQNETLKRQRFENTFFQMMSLQQEIVNGLTIEYQLLGAMHTLKGRDVFSRTFKKSPIEIESGSTVMGMGGAMSKKGIGIYSSLKYPEYFDHYFRHLYRVVKFVDESDLIDRKDKYEYLGIVRATLSRYELVWLFYNCLSENGRDKFKPLIEKYALLKNLRGDLLVNQEHVGLYEPGAYENIGQF